MARQYDSRTTADTIVKDLCSEISGKVVLTTGVSPGGLGAVFNEYIVSAKPKLLILAGRNPSKNQATANTLLQKSPDANIRVLQLDLESLTQIREAASAVNSWPEVPCIDVLVNNAGIMACDYARTDEGLERQFAVSHVGPFLFTNLVIEKVLASPSPRVVNVSSDGHRLSYMRWPDIGFSVSFGNPRPKKLENNADREKGGKLYNKWRAYGQGKTANVLFTVALAERLAKKGLTAVSLHPGVIGTNLGAHLDWNTEYEGLEAVDRELGNAEGWSAGFDFKTPARGVATHVYAAFEPTLKGLWLHVWSQKSAIFGERSSG
ncbi:MAG: hypothetical protein Q9195_008475 [Heterodermia aff. obscurata]